MSLEPASTAGAQTIMGDAAGSVLFEHAPDPLVLCSSTGAILEVNRTFERVFGWPRGVLQGHPVEVLIPAPYREQHGSLRSGFAAQPGARPMGIGRRLQALHYDGTIVPVEIALSEVTFGTERYFLAALRDLSDRETMLSALEASEARFRGAFEQAAVGMAVVGLDGRVQRVNERLCQILGQEREAIDAIGAQLFTPAPSFLGRGRDTLAADTLGSEERRITRPDWTSRWVRITMSVARSRDGEPRYLLAAVEDIDARLTAERQLADREQHLRRVLDSVPVGVTVLDETGRILEINRAGLSLLEAESLDALVGATRIWGATGSEETALRIRRQVERCVVGDAAELEYALGGMRGGTRQVISAMVPFDSPDGDRKILAVTWDVTERRLAEELIRQSQTELRYAQRLESIGRLAGRTLHEFKNVLTVIIGCTDMLLEATDPSHHGYNYLVEVARAAELGNRLSRDLMALGRPSARERKAADVNQLIASMLERLRGPIGKGVDIRFSPDDDAPPVLVDASQFEQVLVNLALNSRDAMPNGGALTVATLKCDDGSPVHAANHLPSGDYVRVSVADTGVGMDELTLQRAREPFFSTKPPSHGSGLGLSTVYDIVTEHDGFISIKSAHRLGTEIIMFIPAAPLGLLPPAPAVTSARLCSQADAQSIVSMRPASAA